MKKLAALLCLLVGLSGCGTLDFTTPYITYPGTHALADTAVFMARDNQSGEHVIATVQAVNETSVRLKAPIGVRVLPGRHTFHIQYTSGIRKTEKLLQLEVDVKPLHVYVARYDEVAGTVSARVEDLGIRPVVGISATTPAKDHVKFD